MANGRAGTQASVAGKLAGKAGAIAPAGEPQQDNTLKGFLERTKEEWSKALPSHVTADRLLRIAVSTVNRTPTLAVCTQQSLVAGVIISSQLGLELNTPLGHAWLVPYKRKVNKSGEWVSIDEAQFQIGYQGVIDLAYRTGLFAEIYAEGVYENDEFDYCYGLNKDLTHKPTNGDPGKLIGIYAVYKLKSGGRDFKYWPVAKIEAHAKKYSGSWDAKENKFRAKSAWADNFDGMAKVPVLKDLLKLAPKSIEFAKQLSLDGTTASDIKANQMGDGIEVEYAVVQPTGELPMNAAEKQEAAVAGEPGAAEGENLFAP